MKRILITRTDGAPVIATNITLEMIRALSINPDALYLLMMLLKNQPDHFKTMKDVLDVFGFGRLKYDNAVKLLDDLGYIRIRKDRQRNKRKYIWQLFEIVVKNQPAKRITCRTCKVRRDATEHNENLKYKSGHNTICKGCEAKVEAEKLRKKNNYKSSSVEYEVFHYFARMKKYLSKKEIEKIVMELGNRAGDMDFFKVLDRLQDKYQVSVADYEFDLLNELKEGRKNEQKNMASPGRGRKCKHKVVKLNLQGEPLVSFRSVAEASEHLGCRKKYVSGIHNCASGKIRQAYGFVWEFKR